MTGNDYEMRTDWELEATLDEVLDAMADPRELPRWWPAVYLDVRELDPGRPDDGVGKRVILFTKGWLPYTLRWELEVTENRHPYGISFRARGDFDGEGHWHLAERDGRVQLTYVWTVRAHKPLLRHLSFLLRPIFALNHDWAMRRGRESLQLELQRRRGVAAVPPPPSPTFLRFARPRTLA